MAVPLTAAAADSAIIAGVLAAIALMLLAGHLFARLATRLRQPAVMGEILAGVALGPSLLGLLPGDLTATLFPPELRPYLMVLAQVGLVLFMFGVGYQLDLGHLRRGGRQISAIAAGSIVLPFAMGVGVAVLLYPWFDRTQLTPSGMWPPVLFVGVAMSITAFPVLARIIVERGLQRERVGSIALACAAVEDVIAWCLLAGLVLLAGATGFLPLAVMLAEAALLMAVLLYVVRPALARLLTPGRRRPLSSAGLQVLLVAGLLLSAWATEAIGLHAIFGAFAFGAIVPKAHIGAAAPEVPERIEHHGLILLPIFFIVTGLSVDLGGLGGQGVVMVVAVVTVAIVSKFAGAASMARLTGLPGREAATLGVLINTRGLTELVILNVGLSLRVVDSRMFTAMVIMALVTTFMAGPLLDRLRAGSAVPPRIQDLEVRERSAASASGMATRPTSTIAPRPHSAAPASQPPET